MQGIIHAVTGNQPGETGNRLIAKLLRGINQAARGTDYAGKHLETID